MTTYIKIDNFYMNKTLEVWQCTNEKGIKYKRDNKSLHKFQHNCVN